MRHAARIIRYPQFMTGWWEVDAGDEISLFVCKDFLGAAGNEEKAANGAIIGSRV